MVKAAGSFFSFSPFQVVINFALVLLQSMTAGIGLIVLIPLLNAFGVDDLGSKEPEGHFLLDKVSVSIGSGDVSLGVILPVYVFIVAIVAYLQYVLVVRSIKLQQSYICFTRDRLYRAVVNCEWQFIVKCKISDFIHALTLQVQSVGIGSQQIMILLSQITTTLFFTGVCFLVSWKMSLIAIIFFGVLSSLLSPLNQKAFEAGRDQILNFKLIFEQLEEQLSSLKFIKSHHFENSTANQLNCTSKKLEEQIVRINQVTAFTKLAHTLGAVFAISILFYISYTWLGVEVSKLIVLMIIFSRLQPGISKIQNAYQLLLNQIPAFDNIEHHLALCGQNQEPSPAPNSRPFVFRDRILLKKVSFSYGNRNILSDFDLEIPKNHSVAIAGASGSGKSTLVDIIAGLIIPTRGDVFCDTIKMENESRVSWRKNIAYVTQESYFLNDTIKKNLIWGNPRSFTDEDLWQALDQASAKSFVKALPRKLDTIVGDRGIKLSGGERQRIAIARALLRYPELLILDEASSALDLKNEENIRNTLNKLKGKLTIIIIAHRNTTIRNVDKLVQL